MDVPTPDPTTTTVARVAAVAALLAVAAVGAAAVWPGGNPAGAGEPATVVEDVAGGETVTVTYATDNGTREFVVEGVDPARVDGDADWAYLPRSSLPPALERVTGNHEAGVVPVGRWALVGDLAAESHHVGAAGVTVVAPAGMDVDPGRKSGFLAKFLSPYTLQGANAEWVTLLVAPDAMPSAGRMYGRTGYVTQHAFWDGEVASVWIHEYVHARQNLSLGPDMRWFTEASATYLSYRLLEEQYSEVSAADVRDRIAATPDHTGTTLANRSALAHTKVDYQRGSRLLYAVDATIRDGSDGNHTLVDVVRAMNHHDETVTVAEFVRIVERYAGTDAGWIRGAITGTGDLDRHLRRAADVFGD